MSASRWTSESGKYECLGCHTLWSPGEYHRCPTCYPDHGTREFTLDQDVAICTQCSTPMRAGGMIMQTLLGYGGFADGHKHDDNCLTQEYVCQQGHCTTISKLRTCPKCEWTGKTTCFCHRGLKVTEWPKNP